MKYYTILLCFGISSAFAQTREQPKLNIYGGNNQIGNNNKQYNYSEPNLTEEMKRNITSGIEKLEYDSNFHYTKYFKIWAVQPCNCSTFTNQFYDFLRQRGLIDAFSLEDGNSSGIGTIQGKRQPNINIDLSPKDSLLLITVGQLDFESR